MEKEAQTVTISSTSHCLRKRKWYRALVEDCQKVKAIREQSIRYKRLLLKMELGARIMSSLVEVESTEKPFFSELSKHIGMNTRQIGYAVEFYWRATSILDRKTGSHEKSLEILREHKGLEAELYVNTWLEALNLGEVISWRTLCDKYLTGL